MEETARNGSLTGLKVMVIDDSKTIRRTAETARVQVEGPVHERRRDSGPVI